MGLPCRPRTAWMPLACARSKLMVGGPTSSSTTPYPRCLDRYRVGPPYQGHLLRYEQIARNKLRIESQSRFTRWFLLGYKTWPSCPFAHQKSSQGARISRRCSRDWVDVAENCWVLSRRRRLIGITPSLGADDWSGRCVRCQGICVSHKHGWGVIDWRRIAHRSSFVTAEPPSTVVCASARTIRGKNPLIPCAIIPSTYSSF